LLRCVSATVEDPARDARAPRAGTLGTLVRLVGLLSGHRRGAIIAVAASLLVVASTTVVPILIGQAVDAIQDRSRSDLRLIAAAILGLGLAGGALLAIREMSSLRLSILVERELRDHLYAHLQSLPLGFFDQAETGQLVSAGTVDARQLRLVVGSTAIAAIQSAATIIAVAAVMLATDPLLAAIALFPVLSMIFLVSRYAERLRATSHRSREALGAVAAQARENIAGIAMIRAFGRERHQRRRFRSAVGSAEDAALEAAHLQARFGAVLSAWPGLGLIAVLVAGGLLAVNDRIADGTFVTFYTYALLLSQPAQQIGWLIGTWQTATAAADRTLEILDVEPMPKPARQPEPLPPGAGAVELTGVGASYRSGDHPVLRGVDLEVAPGTTLAIKGPTGGGKTLLLELVDRLRDPDRGAVRINGADIARVDVGSLRRRVSLVEADELLFTGTIWDNITYGRPAATRAEVARAAELAQAAPFIESLPGGYRTEVGERGTRLSGGQRERIALARALLVDPSLLLLDNPTQSLDPPTEAAVLAGLDGHGRERTTLLVTNRAAPIAIADEVVEVVGGRVSKREHVRGSARRPAAADPPGSGSPGPGPDLGERVEAPDAEGDREPRRETVATLWNLVRPNRLRVALAAAAVVGAGAPTVIGPYLGGRAVDDVLQPNDPGGLLLLSGAMALTVLVGAAAGAVSLRLLARIGQDALARLRTRTMARLQRLPMRFFDRRQTGALISRMTNDVEALDQLLTGGMSVLVSTLVTTGGAIVMLVLVDPGLALIAAPVLPALLVATLWLSRRLAGIYRRVTAATAELTAHLHETLAGIRTVRSFGQEDRHLRRFRELNASVAERLGETVRPSAAYVGGVEVLTQGALAATILVGGIQAIDGAVTIGVVVTFTTYLRTAVAPIPGLAALYGMYQQGVAGLDRIVALLHERTTPASPPGTADIDSARGEVWCRGLRFAYEPGVPVLDRLDLRVAPGETLALVGRSGAGKSSLVKLLLGLYEPQAGQLLIDGRDLALISRASLHRQIGYVPQEPFLLNASVRDNIAFPRPTASDEEIRAAAAAVGALGAIEALPEGFDTAVGERGQNLSSGQRELVALARAVLQDPRILILDEATAGMDDVTEQGVHLAMSEAAKGRTTIVIAHRLSTIRAATRIAVLEGGRIVETGTHEELLGRGDAYARFYQASADAL
jgi:ATP-binding cassette, subfamily B, bacterial